MTQVKKILFVLVGVAVVTAAFMFNKSNNAHADKKEGTKFGDWSVGCTPKTDKTPAVCFLAQQLNATKEDKTQVPVAYYQVGYMGPKNELMILQTINNGVAIDAGTSVILGSKKLIIAGKYSVCNAGSCIARATISKEDLKALLDSPKDNFIGFMNQEGKQANLPLSINGLAEGLEYLKN